MKVSAVLLSLFASFGSLMTMAFLAPQLPRSSRPIELFTARISSLPLRDTPFDADAHSEEQLSSRRRVFAKALSTTSTILLSCIAGCTPVPPAFADGEIVDDLAMPTTDEQNNANMSEEDRIMAERLRLKADLKKKAAEPKTFADSLKGERAKQQEMNKRSKAEQRAALCEELGRGC